MTLVVWLNLEIKIDKFFIFEEVFSFIFRKNLLDLVFPI